MSAAEVIAQSLEGHWGSAAPRQRVQECCTTAVLEALKAAGYAVVKLPDPDEEEEWYEDAWYVNAPDPALPNAQRLRVAVHRMHLPPSCARRFAAAILAAADAAEVAS